MFCRPGATIFHLFRAGALLRKFTLCAALSLVAAAPVAADSNLQSLYNFQLKMASQGSAEAMIKLGEMHEEGLGTEKSDERAREWYQKANEKGHPAAQAHLDNLVKKSERAAREKASREKAAREKAAREQAEKEKAAREQAEKERVAREQAEKERAARENAAREKAMAREAAKKEMSPEEKERARAEAIRRAEEAYEQSLKKQLEKERAESEEIKRAHSTAPAKTKSKSK